MKLKTPLVLFLLLLDCSSLKSYDYDLIILGAGAAGTKAAVLAHRFGKKIALIEKNNKPGGGRLWYGDIPFKTLYSFSNKIMGIKELEEEGLASNSTIHIGDGQVLSRVSQVCEEVYKAYYNKNFLNKEIDFIYGTPQFVDKHTVTVNEKTISASNFLIATGSRSYIPDIPGIKDVPYLTRENFFNIEVVPRFPKSIIIIGGGPLGIELAKVLNQCRVKVTLLVKHAVLLPTYDYEIIEQLTSQLLNEGVNLVCDVQETEVKKENDHVKVTVKNRAGKHLTFESERLFLACGSKPNIENIALENAGVRVNENGDQNPSFKATRKNAIITNSKMQTSTSNIYACGDVTGINELSRVAFYQAELAIQSMFADIKQTMDLNYRNTSQVLFAYPQELAVVGLTEQAALQEYKGDILVYSYSYKLLERAIMEKRQDGIAKFICDKNGILLGVHILGAYAGKMIDCVSIGDDFTILDLEKKIPISTSPSYRELFYETAHLCKLDVDRLKAEDLQKKQGWIQALFTMLPWGKKKK